MNALGVVLIGAALVWLFGWERLGAQKRRSLLLGTALASVGGAVMAVNFHLANGASHPWLIPADGFDEGVDLDSLLPAFQLVLAAVSGRQWWLARRERTVEAAPLRRVRAAE